MSETEHEIDKAEIGQVLRSAREAAGIAIDDVAAVLRIRSDHLQALEDEDFERLPGSVYAIGFIRTYATHLELNAAELIDRYKAATTLPHLEDPSYDPQTEAEPTSNAVKIAIVLAVVFGVYLMWLIASGARDIDDRPQSAQTTIEETEAETPKPAAKAAPLAKAKKAPEPKATPKADAKRQIEPQSVQVNTPPSSDVATDLGLPVADPLASAPAVEVNIIADITPPADYKIEIRATRRTWMRIENTDGKVLFSSIISDDEGFELDEDAPYTLATRDAGALEYLVDGEAVGAVGRRGQILTARKVGRDTILALKP